MIYERRFKEAKKKGYYEIQLNELIKFAGGLSFLKKKFKYDIEVYDFLMQKDGEFQDVIFKKGYDEVGQSDPTQVMDYCNNHFDSMGSVTILEKIIKKKKPSLYRKVIIFLKKYHKEDPNGQKWESYIKDLEKLIKKEIDVTDYYSGDPYYFYGGYSRC